MIIMVKEQTCMLKFHLTEHRCETNISSFCLTSIFYFVKFPSSFKLSYAIKASISDLDIDEYEYLAWNMNI